MACGPGDLFGPLAGLVREAEGESASARPDLTWREEETPGQYASHCMQHSDCLTGQAVITPDRHKRLLHPGRWKVVKRAIAAASPAQDPFARATYQFDPARPVMPGRAGAALVLKKGDGDDEARPDRFAFE